MRNRVRRVVAALAALVAGATQAAGVTLYRDEHYAGPKVEVLVGGTIDDVLRSFGGRSPASVLVNGGEWQFCELPGFRGRCVTTGPGNFLRLDDLGMAHGIGSLRSVERVSERLGGAAAARESITLYLHDGFQGESLELDRAAADLRQYNANDKASSAIVRGVAWQLCSDTEFGGRCVVLAPGQYPSLRVHRLNDAVSSARPDPQRTSPKR